MGYHIVDWQYCSSMTTFSKLRGTNWDVHFQFMAFHVKSKDYPVDSGMSHACTRWWGTPNFWLVPNISRRKLQYTPEIGVQISRQPLLPSAPLVVPSFFAACNAKLCSPSASSGFTSHGILAAAMIPVEFVRSTSFLVHLNSSLSYFSTVALH